jgi:endonuclease/exonuclease/phosphatase family metal-dependent hydrolase
VSVAPRQVRLATFNIQHGRKPGGRVDVDLVGGVVAGLRADVVGLQEVDDGVARSGRLDTAAVAAGAAGAAGAFGQSLTLPDGGRYGNAVLVRGAVDDVEVVVLPPRPPGPGPGRGERRTALLATAACDAGPVLSVAVCHLGLGPGEAPAQLAVALRALAARPAPRVLLGDLNLPPRVVRPIVEAAGFTLADGAPTFPAGFPVRRIDHVALDGLEVVATTVVPTPVSDHRPLVVDACTPAGGTEGDGPG